MKIQHIKTLNLSKSVLEGNFIVIQLYIKRQKF